MANVFSWMFVKAVLLMCIVSAESKCRQRCRFDLVEQGIQTCPQGMECKADKRCHAKVFEDPSVCIDKLGSGNVTECIIVAQNCNSEGFTRRKNTRVEIVNTDVCTTSGSQYLSNCGKACDDIDCEFFYYLGAPPFTCTLYHNNCEIRVTADSTKNLFDYKVC